MNKAIIVMVSICLLITLTNTSATPDNGDGWEACNLGEICFHDLSDTERYRKHFFRNANHDGIQWWDAVANRRVGWLRDDANTIRNRHREKCVKVIDDRGWWGDDVFVVPRDGILRVIPASVQNQNDRHERFNC